MIMVSPVENWPFALVCRIYAFRRRAARAGERAARNLQSTGWGVRERERERAGLGHVSLFARELSGELVFVSVEGSVKSWKTAGR